MRKLTLDLNALAVQSFATEDVAARLFGTVHGRQQGKTGQQDTDCSAVDACPSPRGCTRGPDCVDSIRGCSDLVACLSATHECTRRPSCGDPSAVDACPSARGCSDLVECESSRACSEYQCRPTSHGCTREPNCEDPSAVDACPSARGCTEVDCPAPA